MKVDFEKIAIIACYFAENTNNLYVTKLLKLFYYLDFISYKIRKASVSNDVYFKFPYGPVPSTIKDNIDLLSSENIIGDGFETEFSKFIKLERDTSGNGSLVKSQGKNYDLGKLSKFEFNLMESIAKTFKDTNGKTLSNRTHEEKPWLSTNSFAIIDYTLAEDLEIEKILPSFSV